MINITINREDTGLVTVQATNDAGAVVFNSERQFYQHDIDESDTWVLTEVRNATMDSLHPQVNV